MEQEIWKSVPGYEGLYEVSTFGRVRSVGRYANVTRTIRGKIQEYSHYLNSKILRLQVKKAKRCAGGVYKNLTYLGLSLYKEGKYYNELVHRLVAKAFIPNPNNYPTVNHKNCNSHDNRVSNLEWCTYQYNNTYADRLIKSVNTYHKNRNK